MRKVYYTIPERAMCTKSDFYVFITITVPLSLLVDIMSWDPINWFNPTPLFVDVSGHELYIIPYVVVFVYVKRFEVTGDCLLC